MNQTMEPIARVAGLAHVRFRAPDLDRMECFLTDFGLVRAARDERALYMRATDPAHHVHVTELGEPGFAGFAFAASTREDLDRLAGSPAATGPVEAMDAPGGGARVTLRDPDGLAVEVVHGVAAAAPLPTGPDSAYNWGGRRVRLGTPTRLQAGTCPVKRLGHVVLLTPDFRRKQSFYERHFGIIASDEIYPDDDPERTMMAFSRVDRGDDFVDHHTLALIEGDAARFHHAAFEVENFDAVVLGHEHLRARGYDHALGIGRHYLGSQIFDYWLDPWGNRVEHWTDGDLLNRSSGTERAPLSVAIGRQWGPTVPEPGKT